MSGKIILLISLGEVQFRLNLSNKYGLVAITGRSPLNSGYHNITFISSIKHGNALCTVKGRGTNMITYIIRLNSKMVAHKTQ